MKKKDKKDMQQPMMVSSHDVKLDAEYAEWIAEVKHRYRSAQVKAAVKVNAEKLLWNWQMGRDLVEKKAEERWGAGIVEQVSLDLRREFPDSSNFSARNLWYMKQWYLFLHREHGKTETACFRISATFRLCTLGASCSNCSAFRIRGRSPVLCKLHH